MSEGMRRWLRRLRHLLGRQPPAPPPAAGARTSRGAATPHAPVLPPGWELPPVPGPKVTYRRESVGVGRGSSMPARVRAIRRELALILLALVTAVVVGGYHLAGAFVDRTLPPAVRGTWRTDGAGYEDRLFELTATRVAFQVSDSAFTVHPVVSVRRSRGEAGTEYRVEYLDEGERVAFDFIFSPGTPDEIRLVHQPFMVWTRVTDRRRLMPEVYD